MTIFPILGVLALKAQLPAELTAHNPLRLGTSKVWWDMWPHSSQGPMGDL